MQEQRPVRSMAAAQNSLTRRQLCADVTHTAGGSQAFCDLPRIVQAHGSSTAHINARPGHRGHAHRSGYWVSALEEYMRNSCGHVGAPTGAQKACQRA